MSPRPLISYVFPVYCEEGNIELLHEQVSAAIATIDVDVELVFVNDGSTDGSLALLQSLSARDDRVVVVDLARNVGHQIAVTAGIDHARGDAIIIMDADAVKIADENILKPEKRKLNTNIINPFIAILYTASFVPVNKRTKVFPFIKDNAKINNEPTKMKEIQILYIFFNP